MDHYFLYLHGYQSSPTTLRALKLQLWLREQYPESRIDAPRLSDRDALGAFEKINARLDRVDNQRKVVIGASLGGLMAHLLKQVRSDITDVILINPALRFDDILANMGLVIGTNGEGDISQEDVDIIRSFIPTEIDNQEDYLLLLQQDDEVCPYLWSVDLLADAHVDIQNGQGHSYQNIETAFDVMDGFIKR
ncbi:MAG: hypothetical protein EP298_04450 [Gammaproteobacteria bacterium]|nr:MAG: hypothetical protein EP298_04450 [Gammaproteobacteria bacterium]UTW41662.1 hypothetical protein KFE69_09100 [bacterium SCSIO 12844]